MDQVAITYRAAGAEGPPRGEIRRTLPSRWQDMTPEHAWHCMDMVIRGQPRRQLVEYLLQLPDFIQDRLEHEVIYDLLRCITWMDIDAASTAPIAPHIDVPGACRMYLPTERFKSVSCREYALIDDTYPEYIIDQDRELEVRLVALVLRPGGWSPDSASDPRVQLRSREHSEEWLDVVRLLPESIRVYIITLISANRALIRSQYAHWLFTDVPSMPEEDGEDGSAPSSGSGLNFGWWGAYMDVAEDGLFGTYEEVLDSSFHDVCMHMVRKVETARIMKQEQDHARARAGS